MKRKKVNKIERSILRKEKLSQVQSGSGLFLFKNKTNASLQLPKRSSDGKIWVEANQTWEGDSFFIKMIPKEAMLVKKIKDPEEEKMQEEKLILDQPDQITNEGKIEHVVEDEVIINEVKNKTKRKTKSESNKNKDKLITENPIEGVTIIRD